MTFDGTSLMFELAKTSLRWCDLRGWDTLAAASTHTRGVMTEDLTAQLVARFKELLANDGAAPAADGSESH